MEFFEYTYADLSATAKASLFKPEGGVAESHIIVNCTDPRLPYAKQLSNAQQALERTVAEMPKGSAVMFKRYFLSDATNQAWRLPREEGCAVSVVEQAPLNGTKVAIWAQLMQDAEIQKLDGGLYAASHGQYRHLWRGGMSAPDLSSEIATIAMLGDYNTSLRNQGCTLADNCLRTWFFVHDVDINYKGVVYGRNEVFRCSGLTTHTHFIASTGIGGKHPDPRVLVELDAYAVDGITPAQVRYLQAPTHLNPTYEYGVAFERGTSIDYADRRHVLISGTASINNRGEVVHEGDIIGQTRRMIDNVQALLAAADSGWADVSHAIVYLRDTADYLLVSEMLAERFPSLPLTIVLAPVCRHGWLIEMECMAIKPIASAFPAL